MLTPAVGHSRFMNWPSLVSMAAWSSLLAYV